MGTSLASLETAKLPQLSELVANHNQLESLASEVASNWSAIKRLDLSNNNLKTVPSQLPSLSKMKDLSLINNPLSDKRLRKLCVIERDKVCVGLYKGKWWQG